MEVDSKPEEIDELDRRLIQLKIEQAALKKETDKASKERLGNLEKEIAELSQKSAELTAQWRREKDKLAGAQKLKRRSTKRAASSRSPSARAGSTGPASLPTA